MDNYAERFNNNDSIETSTSSLPAFPGRMVMYNNNTGTLALVVQGQDVATAQEVHSIKLAVDFTMTRLKYRQGQDMSENSNYVVTGEKNPFKLTVMNKTYVAKSKREMLEQMQLNSGETLSQEVIYVGYIVAIDGQPCPVAEPVWYVSRGINAWRLNDELQAIGGLTMQTMINLIANKEQYKNSNGGTNLVLSFETNNLDDSKKSGFVNWVTKDGSTQKVADYKEAMIKATTAEEEALTTSNPVAEPNPFTGGQTVDIADDDLPF
ncbi:hypothetical protein [Weissella viridescens]|uniref:hypothetical protein n=1 Tax=Weissella viridescens TaxID=1629 RepID=UPI0022E725F9|nr:hypothetical protein [Weissella viridescens]